MKKVTAKAVAKMIKKPCCKCKKKVDPVLNFCYGCSRIVCASCSEKYGYMSGKGHR